MPYIHQLSQNPLISYNMVEEYLIYNNRRIEDVLLAHQRVRSLHHIPHSRNQSAQITNPEGKGDSRRNNRHPDASLKIESTILAPPARKRKQLCYSARRTQRSAPKQRGRHRRAPAGEGIKGKGNCWEKQTDQRAIGDEAGTPGKGMRDWRKAPRRCHGAVAPSRGEDQLLGKHSTSR